MRKTVDNIALCLALGLLYNTSIGYAADELLAKTELNRAGEKVTAELWANPIKGGYMDNLTVIFKRADESIITAYKPTVTGGYSCLLKPVNVIDKESDEQLLLSVGRGSWTVPSSFHIIDYDKKGKVTEVFGGKENLGVIVNVDVNGNSLKLSLKNGNKNEARIVKSLNSVETKRLNFDGIYSLVPYDYDKDGVDELFLDQEVKARTNLLADVGYMLKYDKEDKSWHESMVTLMSNGLTDKQNTVNEGRAFGGGIFMPRKVVLPFGEGTYPEFAGAGIDAENKVNRILKDELATYMSKVFDGSKDLAFNILRSDSKLWSIQLISGKEEFEHHHINIDPKSYEKVKLDQILNMKHKKLIPAMNKLSEEGKLGFNGSIPDEWYITKNDLHLVQKNAEGKDQTIVFPLEKLNEFIIDKKWVVEKPKEEPKVEKEKTKEEKFWDKLTGTDKKEEANSEESAQKEEGGSSSDKTE